MNGTTPISSRVTVGVPALPFAVNATPKVINFAPKYAPREYAVAA